MSRATGGGVDFWYYQMSWVPSLRDTAGGNGNLTITSCQNDVKQGLLIQGEVGS